MIGFNWNECQTTFMQGRAAMWWDGIGFSAPLIDPTKSKVVGKIGFAPDPAGPRCATARRSSTASASRRPAKNKKAAWLFVQWATGKDDADRGAAHRLRHAARACPATTQADLLKGSAFPQEWFETTRPA